MQDIFKLLPKPCNTHIHFSGFVNYKVILNDILNNKVLMDNILVNKRNYNLSFYKEYENETYEKIKMEDIDAIHSIMKNIDRTKMFKLGGIFYGIVRNFDYWRSFYLPNIIKKMSKHNIYYMEIRTKLGSCIDDYGNKISIIKELEELYKYKKYFSIIVQSGKCNENACKYFDKIIKQTINTKFFDFIKGYDLVGDEAKCLNLEYFYKDLQKLKEKYKINYYMHAGETFKSPNNYINVKYAIKLKCIRIGHGIYSFTNNELISVIKQNKIFLEICPLAYKILHNYDLNIKDIVNNIDFITVGSDDDNKYKTNLSSDYLFLYEKGLNLNQIKKILLNCAKFNPFFDIKKFNSDFEIFMEKLKSN
jgi:adenosine deaminase